MAQKKSCFFLFFLIIPVLTFSQIIILSSPLQKAFRQLEKGNYIVASQDFTEILEDNPDEPAAYFGMATIHIAPDPNFYHPDLAFEYINKSLSSFNDKHQKSKAYHKLGITSQRINNLRNRIEDEIFKKTVSYNSIEGYELFFKKYPQNRNIPKARELYTQNSFFVKNTFRSLKELEEFITENPQSPLLDEALRLRNNMAFSNAVKENSISAFEEFIVRYPDAAEIPQAKNMVSGLVYLKTRKIHTMEAYEDFVKNHPNSLEAAEAKLHRNNLAYLKMMEQVKKKGQEEILLKDAMLREQKFRLKILVSGVLGLLIMFALLLRGYEMKRKHNFKISRQKEIIEVKNREILDSVSYAHRIQSAMMHTTSDLKRIVNDSFIFFNPRDVVSGDFYWCAEVNGKTIIATADCTGHGIPGALLSMVGYNFLNQIVKDEKQIIPGKILDELHRRVCLFLNNENSGNDRKIRDGMDISILSFEKESRRVQYSGAVRPLIIIDESGMKIIRGEMYSVGGIKSSDNDPFETLTFYALENTCFYLFSDGFADQFGGPVGKKFKSKKLQDLIYSVSFQPMEIQGNIMEETFRNWKGENDQVDDVCVVGLRI